MKSSERSRTLDLDRSLPTTAQDVAALRRAKGFAPLDLDGYLRFLAQLPIPTAAQLRAKRGPSGDHPFEIPR